MIQMEALAREEYDGLDEGSNEVRGVNELPAVTRIVCIGGGTGLPVVLRGLVRHTKRRWDQPGVDLTAIVAMSDDGGSSGRLRRSRGMLPPGDVRNCLVALARGKNDLSRVFQYRFGGAADLKGHAVGNLLLTALSELKGGFLEAVQLSAQWLDVQGTVLPSTLSPVELVATMSDSSVVLGERNLARTGRRVVRVALNPRVPPPTEGTLEAIHRADLITIGPGSLYSSVLPNLLVGGIAEALQKTRAPKVLIGNLMTQPGETDGMSGLDHVRAVIDHVGPVVDAVLIDVSERSPEVLDWYQRRGGCPVSYERRAVLQAGVIPIEADLVREGTRIRHDPKKVASCLLKIARSGL